MKFFWRTSCNLNPFTVFQTKFWENILNTVCLLLKIGRNWLKFGYIGLMQLKFLNKKIFEKMKFFSPSWEGDYMTDKSHHLCQKLTFLVVSFLLILVPLWLFLLFSPLLCRFLLLQHLNYCDTCNLLEIKLIQILVFLKHCGWLVCWLDLLVISAVINTLIHVWWFFSPIIGRNLISMLFFFLFSVMP